MMAPHRRQQTVMLITIIYTCLFYANGQEYATNNQTESYVFQELLNDYDKSQLPYQGRATKVNIGIYAHSIYGISEINMDYHMNFYLHMSWRDPRLKLKYNREWPPNSRRRAPHGFWRHVWTPDLHLRNEHVQESTVDPHRVMELSGDGEVWYVIKSTVTLSCPMKLVEFPFDTQVCPMVVESFGYTKDELSLSWMKESLMEINPGLRLPEYTVQDVQTSHCEEHSQTDTTPCLEVELILKRDIGYFVLQVFVPSLILVIISWTQFYLDPGEAASRVVVGLFSFFTIVGQMTALRSSLPGISYLTILDVWMLACLLFIASTLPLLVVVHGLHRKESRDLTEDQEIPTDSISARIDRASRVLFPVLFTIFCAIYWGVFCLGGLLWLQRLITQDMKEFFGNWRLKSSIIQTD